MFDPSTKDRIRRRLALLYADRADECLDHLEVLAERYAPALAAAFPSHAQTTTWDQRDTVLITYGDQVQRDGLSPLRAQREFLADAGLKDLLRTVHILPFFPYSSDDGFSVIDYRQVDPAVGDWSDVVALGEDYRLMFDLVLNHVSRASHWFFDFTAGKHPYTEFFIDVDPQTDLSMVTRPRSHPLLAPVETSWGTRHLWATFSHDQLDLNFAEPDVLLEMFDILLFYLQQGARIVRLDAIAYLWKEIGTSCIHRPQTHAVVKLIRDLVDVVAPGCILLTETNVPHAENYSYFGDGDEAQMVYQFSLAPLLLEAILSGDATLLAGWLRDLEPTPPGTTVLNFTASHDGIGVRPLEGIMPPERFERLLVAVKDRNGRVSMKRNPDGSESPYELNITYFSALQPDEYNPDKAEHVQRHVDRFLASQAIMLSLKGIPGIYFHSLMGTPNDLGGVQQTGRARSINRRKFQRTELDALLSPVYPASISTNATARGAIVGGESVGAQAKVLDGFRHLLAVRISQPAFHPDGAQEVVELGDPALLGILRTSPDGQHRVLVTANLGPQLRNIDMLATVGCEAVGDLLDVETPIEPVTLRPYQVAWLTL